MNVVGMDVMGTDVVGMDVVVILAGVAPGTLACCNETLEANLHVASLP